MSGDIGFSSTFSTTIQGNNFGPPPNGPPLDGPPPNGPPPDGPPPGGMGGGGSNAIAVSTEMQRDLALYGYIFLFLFGYFGHINTITIFLRPTLRTVSTSCLFVCVTLSNAIYVSVCIYDFLVVGLGLSPVNSQTSPTASYALCRFRSFLQSVAMCSSAWLLLAISIDRWLRIRWPFHVRKLCTRTRALLAALIILVCAVALNSHLLLPYFGSLSTTICGPVSNGTFSYFFRQVWGVLLTCLQTVLPTIGLLVLTIDMFIRLRHQQKQKRKLQQGGRRNAFIDRQMLIIMLTSIFVFFFTQIPLSLFNILLSPVLRTRLTMKQALDLTSIVNYVASINYATTFYVHCLTSGLFRKESYNVLRSWFGVNNRRTGVVTQMLGQTTQTRIGLTQMRGKKNGEEFTVENVQ